MYSRPTHFSVEAVIRRVAARVSVVRFDGKEADAGHRLSHRR